MFKRLILGIIKGVFVGAVVAAVLIKGLGVVTWGAPLAFLFGAITGVLTALVSGKAIWVRGAGVENGIKAVVALGLASIVIFATRKWFGASVDLSAFQAGAGRVGDLPAVTLPLVGTVLALLFELDNTGEAAKEQARQSAKVRVAEVGPGAKELALEEAELGPSSTTERQRERRR